MIGIAERRYLTASKVAKIFDVDPATINRWAKTGELKGCRIGRGWRFLPEDVEAFIKPTEDNSPRH